MKCETVQELIPAYRKGQLGIEEEQVVAHIKECEMCLEFSNGMESISKELQNIPKLKPREGFLDKIHAEILKREVGSKGSKRVPLRSSSQSLQATALKTTFMEKFLSYFKSPVFIYSLAIHFVLFGLAFSLFRANTAQLRNTMDIQHLRYQAYLNAQQQIIKNNSIDVSLFRKDGNVYLVETADCLQLQFNKPLKGKYVLVVIEHGVLYLDSEVVNKYFIDKEVTLLVFNNAIKVWSKTKIDNYIKEEIPVNI